MTKSRNGVNIAVGLQYIVCHLTTSLCSLEPWYRSPALNLQLFVWSVMRELP